MEEALKGQSWEKYSPHKPFPKQAKAMELKDVKEVFFGGAAGPGKTDWLLMEALAYVDVPRYAALILRRDYARLNLPGAIMNRAREWLFNKDCKWNGSDHRFTFPSGAVLQFGYIDNPLDAQRYQSTEFQFLGYDELTEFRLGDEETNPYLFMFNRLRAPECAQHKMMLDPLCSVCKESYVLSRVPQRIRAASNPGNEGHEWVKNRFISQEAIEALKNGEDRIFYQDPMRAFIPALAKDNKAINTEKYFENLDHLPPVTRERLKNGDWTVKTEGLIRVDWLRYYTMYGSYIQLRDVAGNLFLQFDERECQWLATGDTAGTTKDKGKERQGKSPSWSVIAVWCKYKQFLILKHIWRARVGFPELLKAYKAIHFRFPKARIYIENKHFGPAVKQMIHEFPIQLVDPGSFDKVTRATDLLNKLEQGEVYLPKENNGWRMALESEWLGWTGQDDETNDQIDVAAYAATLSKRVGGSWGGSSAVVTPYRNVFQKQTANVVGGLGFGNSQGGRFGNVN